MGYNKELTLVYLVVIGLITFNRLRRKLIEILKNILQDRAYKDY